MQQIIVEKPYRFIPPHRGDWIPTLIQRFHVVDWYLKRFEGITSYEVRHGDRLRESLRQRRGIILAPNHCRYADPIAMGWVAREVDVFIYSMASWHLFNQSRLQTFAIGLCGGFSVYREGVDRQSLETAVGIITEAKRPLVVFPEGTVFRSNDLLQPLMDGVAFLARAAARRRIKHGLGDVVIHPVAIKYLFRGNLEESIEPILSSLEQRLAWNRLGKSEHLLDRIARIDEAQLALKEIQYLGRAQCGTMSHRRTRMVEHLLIPLEIQWLGKPQESDLLPRVKQLRSAIVPCLFEAKFAHERRMQLWSQLADIYLAQQIASPVSDYLNVPTDTRVLETVERIEEDMTDRTTLQRPLHAVLEVGEAIDVDGSKPAKGETDPLMIQIASSLGQMLARLSTEAKPIIKPS
jgi:hypothetical protein